MSNDSNEKLHLNGNGNHKTSKVIFNIDPENDIKVTPVNERKPNTLRKNDLINNLPRYLLENGNSKLKNVDTILKQSDEEETPEETKDKKSNGTSYEHDKNGEVSEYPIELNEEKKFTIERHMSVRYVINP